MGRAMLIICSGVLITLGFVVTSTSDTGESLAIKTSEYAKQTHARNAAQTAIQVAFNHMNDDDEWASDHQGSGNAWGASFQGAQTSLFLDKYVPTSAFFEPDSIRVVSTAEYLGTQQTVVSLYLKNNFDQFVPDFPSPLTIATSNYTFNAQGSSSINGNAPNGCPENKPAVTLNDQSLTKGKEDNVKQELSGIDAEGASPLVKNDANLSYQPTDALIARLRNADDVQKISGSYKGELGSETNPGVFFVEEQATLTGGIKEGYGILVVRSSGSLALQDSTGGELDIAGNFTFNGLVIFENAYNFDGNGTPTINGSVLIGTTEEYDDNGGSPIDIDINGNLHLQYDCKGEEYAKMAAAQAIKQNKFTRVVSYQ